MYFILYPNQIQILNADTLTYLTKISGEFLKITIREGVNIACLTSNNQILIYNYTDLHKLTSDSTSKFEPVT